MFNSRQEVGQLLAKKLKQYAKKKNVVVLGIARGGVVVAKEIAKLLSLPLFIMVVKKIGAPYSPELAIGAIGPENSVYWDEKMCEYLQLSQQEREYLQKQKQKEFQEKENMFKRFLPPQKLEKVRVLVVDDGVATGATVVVVAHYLRKKNISDLILVTPVIARDTLISIKKYFNTIITLKKPAEFHAVGEFYRDFPQIEDEEVIKLLQ